MYSLYINNKHGSLVYQKDFSCRVNLSSNDKIRIASTFHALCTISQQISPTPQRQSQGAGAKVPFSFLQPIGIEFIEADTFKLQCFETITGLRYFVVAQPGMKDLRQFLEEIHRTYTDLVLKNPFYDRDMPIRVESFDKQVMLLWDKWKIIGGTV
eukprot:GHVR01175544.1.p1 GENE.GHVR01175544.1~~GHVR01175544.1.p1  ORF type:complete len:155 (+),score=19.41 GHVR01175544.1:95-559(+)